MAQRSKLLLFFFSFLNSVWFSTEKNQPNIHLNFFLYYFQHKKSNPQPAAKRGQIQNAALCQRNDQFQFCPVFSRQPSVVDLMAAVPVSWFCPIAVKPDELQDFSDCGGYISSVLCNLCSPALRIIWNVTFLFSVSAAAVWQLSLRPSVHPVACSSTCRSESVDMTARQHFWGVPFLFPPSSSPFLPVIQQLHPGENMSVALAPSNLHVWSGRTCCDVSVCCIVCVRVHVFGGLSLFPPTMLSCSRPGRVYFTNFPARAHGTRPQWPKHNTTAVNVCVCVCVRACPRVCVRCFALHSFLLQPWNLQTYYTGSLVICVLRQQRGQRADADKLDRTLTLSGRGNTATQAWQKKKKG